MTTSLTRNLRLRVSSNLSDTARYNLERIDDAFGNLPVFVMTLAGDVAFHATSDINIEANAGDLGGTGTGGTVTIGRAISGTDPHHVTNVLGDLNLNGSHVLTHLEETLLYAAIAAVQAELDQEEIDRAAADATLQNNIDAEANARILADNNLQIALNAEALTRATDDGIIAGNLAQEIIDRAAADLVLQNDINTKEDIGVAASLLAGHLSAFAHGDIAHSNRTALDAVTGVNTGDETQTTIKTKLGVASSGVDGYISGTDWSTFNAKQVNIGASPSGAGDTGFVLTATTAGNCSWQAASGGGSTVKITVADTTPGVLSDKLVEGTGISLTVVDPAGNETLEVANTDTGSAAVGTHEGTYPHANIPSTPADPADDTKVWTANSGTASWQAIPTPANTPTTPANPGDDNKVWTASGGTASWQPTQVIPPYAAPLRWVYGGATQYMYIEPSVHGQGLTPVVSVWELDYSTGTYILPAIVDTSIITEVGGTLPTGTVVLVTDEWFDGQVVISVGDSTFHPEMLVMGNFADANDGGNWIPDGWSITAGQAAIIAYTERKLTQQYVLNPGSTYEVSVEILTSYGGKIAIGDGTDIIAGPFSGTGIHTATVTVGASAQDFVIYSSDGDGNDLFSGSISNASARLVS